MNNKSFTPGPWELVTKNDKYGEELLVVKPTPNSEYSQVICGSIMGFNDAQLIAAAPDLLEALRLTLSAYISAREDIMCGPACFVGDEAYNKAKAAIAKARGQK